MFGYPRYLGRKIHDDKGKFPNKNLGGFWPLLPCPERLCVGRPNHLAVTNFGELYFQKITTELPGNVSSPFVIHRVWM